MRFIQIKEVSHLISLSPTQIRRRETDGTFPKSGKLGYRRYWVEEEVQAWMKAEAEKRTNAPAGE